MKTMLFGYFQERTLHVDLRIFQKYLLQKFNISLEVPVVLLFCEGIYTVRFRGGQDYKFITPCIALYLGAESFLGPLSPIQF